MRLTIGKSERYLLYKKGEYEKLLKPGKHWFPPFKGYAVDRFDLTEPFEPKEHFSLYKHDKTLVDELHIVDVKDNEIALHFEDDHFSDVLKPGIYYFWNVLVKHEFVHIDLNSPEVPADIDIKLLNHEKLRPYLFIFDVEPFEKGLLFFDGKFQGVLEKGRYYFWSGAATAAFHKADMRQQQLDMTGQEIMTKDKVTIRLNFFCHYKIVEPYKALVEIKKYEEQLYILMQLILREYVGSLTLDELLDKKEEIGFFILEKLKDKKEAWGLDFVYAGVKDIVLPGEIKEILNQVLEAEKRAQANIITRREETASTRSLLNTAKLMENNTTLFKLKELEHIERISEKISSLNLNGGMQILEQLRELFGTGS